MLKKIKKYKRPNSFIHNPNQKNVLITGGFGFLGRMAAAKFKLNGYRVIGIGTGRWDKSESILHGFDSWLDASVTMSSLLSLDEQFDVIVHCAGGSSVGYSLSNPRQDFNKTVESTSALLEYIRLNNPSALLIYPSSAAVYGLKNDAAIKETDPLNPISPYGYHKRIVEELCEFHSKIYGLHAVIIRFFSIYGPWLTKQLLWDASLKLITPQAKSLFHGTGNETRDWIYIEDAAELILLMATQKESFIVINGASGNRMTVKKTIEMLRDALGSPNKVIFNNTIREGDPRFYHADMSQINRLKWTPKVSLEDGISKYATWFKNFHHG